MALKVEDWFEDGNTSKVVAGIGAIVLAPIVIPAVAKASKPIAKALLKGGILAYQKSRVIIAETGEVLEDLMAEVQAEIASEQEQQNLD